MIHIENLSKTYATPHGLFQALRGINLHIEQGEVFGIIGPSGAGKSTLVQCINLLERPNEGSIAIGGQPLTGLGEAQLRAQRRRIGMVFQGFNLLSRRTVYGNVALPLEIAGVPKSEIPARGAPAGPGRPGAPARPLSQPDQRRPEAARGHRARAGQ